jgi:hypothetical protein
VKRTVCGIILIVFMFSMLTLAFNTQPAKAEHDSLPAVEWSKRYHGATASVWEGLPYFVIQTADGGYAIAGCTDMFHLGNWDFLLIRTDANGNAQWNKTYGGVGRERLWSFARTSDGGYVLAGDLPDTGLAWLVKTDANGIMQWNKTYGLNGAGARSVVQTDDGGYALAGIMNGAGYDGFLIKTDDDGIMLWCKTYGGASNDQFESVVQTSDGGYALAGATQSFSPSGKVKAYLVKTNASGIIEWSKTFSRTTGHDYGRSMIQARDGGYAIVGQTDYFGSGDAWLIKTDVVGNLLWDKTYDGKNSDSAVSIVQTSDGGYALAGQTDFWGSGDAWLIKTNSTGILLWSKTFGGAGYDRGCSVIQTRDGGYASSGFTNSFTDDDSYEVWLIKLAPSLLSSNPPVANFNWFPSTPITNESITFNASSSLPGWNGTQTMPITEYRWNFGDGSITSTPNSTITHLYLFSGIFNVTLTIFDGAGLNSSCSKLISTRMSTFVSISTSSSSTYAGFKVDINGTLYDLDGNGLRSEPVVIYYTFPGVTTWFTLTSSITDNLGRYYVQWIPYATGYFTIKAEWTGNATHIGASNSITLTVIPYTSQYVFSVESNSTVSTLAFNTTSWELTFTASGPSGTRGYVKVTVAKSLVANITNIRVYLDGNQTEYTITSIDDSWLLTFNYTHSTHQITVDLDINIVPEYPTTIILLLFMSLTMLTAVLSRKKMKK